MQWVNAATLNKMARDTLLKYNIPVTPAFNITAPLHDNHVGTRLSAVPDCLHYCSPGVPEVRQMGLTLRSQVGICGDRCMTPQSRVGVLMRYAGLYMLAALHTCFVTAVLTVHLVFRQNNICCLCFCLKCNYRGVLCMFRSVDQPHPPCCFTPQIWIFYLYNALKNGKTGIKALPVSTAATGSSSISRDVASLRTQSQQGSAGQAKPSAASKQQKASHRQVPSDGQYVCTPSTIRF